MLRQFREISHGEFFVIFADTSAGGNDYNACQFLSKTKLDIPLVYHQKGIANEMTNFIFPIIEKIHDITGVQPVVCYENNNGGIFELERLSAMNRLGKYNIFRQNTYGTITTEETNKIGWTTNVATRPRMLQDFKNAIDHTLLKIYDKQTLAELYSFIISKTGKPEAENNSHDDLVMSGAGAWQLYQLCETPQTEETGDYPDTSFINKTFY